ncbi:MAG: Hsp70 family protein [Chloroflexi bacterium]|nr:Hsp70 family protein [Chloroflexota bacterium]
MARTAIDFGIDLGTTNSAMAVAHGGDVEMVRNTNAEEITASAVWCDNPGSYVVGRAAYEAAGRDPQNVAVRFKRFIGDARPHVFARTGTSLGPEELSAKVLDALLDGAAARFGERPTAAVVTVPADFEIYQCQATERAARLAGLDVCPILQEPVAAAQAYGFQDETERDYWLIYDMGAGTLDVALLRIEDGVMRIAGQRGDNDLGGMRFDEDIVARLLVPHLLQEQGVDLSAPDEAVTAQLCRIVERAKIQLSNPTAQSARCADLVRVGPGQVVEIDYELTRSRLEAIVAPYVLRSVRICRDLLHEHRLSPADISKVILVGGPTHASILRQILLDPTEGLGIPLEHRLDPMTVVARGAALWASSQPLQVQPTAAVVPASTFVISFPDWPTVGDDDDLEVHGTVEAEGTASFGGYTLEFANEASAVDWTSGRISLSESGAFAAMLYAEKGIVNRYTPTLRNGRGAVCTTVTRPQVLEHTRGRLIEDARLSHSFGVALADGGMTWLAQRNDILPLKSTRMLSSAWEVRHDREGDRIVIPLMEGESDDAAKNHETGALVIPADRLGRDLPADAAISLMVEIDVSRLVTATVTFPTLGQTYEHIVDMREIRPPDPADTERRAQQALERLEAVEKEVTDSGAPAPPALVRVREDGVKQEIREAVEVVGTNPDAAARCERRSRDLLVQIDEMERALAPVRAERNIAWAKRVLAEYGTEEEREQLRGIEAGLGQTLALPTDSADAMEEQGDQAFRIALRALDRADILPVWHFEWFEKQIYDIQHRDAAMRWIAAGRQALRNNDVDELRRVNRELWSLLPYGATSKIDSTVIQRYRR